MMLRLTLLACGAMLLSGCTQTNERISPDFGDAITLDITSQIADPNPHYSYQLPPGYDGARATLAQQRYQKDQVIAPSSITASSPGSVGNVDNGSAATPTAAAQTGVAGTLPSQ